MSKKEDFSEAMHPAQAVALILPESSQAESQRCCGIARFLEGRPDIL